MVLEELEHAKARSANIYAELTGYGSTADAYRMTDPHPQGRGAIRCMAEAIADAGLEADRHRLHQRPRHEHAGQRLDRDGGDQGACSATMPTRCRSRAARACWAT